MPSHSRGQRLVTTSYFWTTATLLVPILAYVTLDIKHSWRLFVASCALPCVVSAVVGVYVVPESPRFLLLQGDSAQALKILRDAAITNGRDPSVLFPEGVQIISQQHESESASFFDLLSAGRYKTSITLWCLWGGYAFLYYGTIIAVTLVFSRHPEDQGSSGDSTIDSNKLYHFDYVAMIVSSSAEIAGVTWVLFSVDKFGRINSMTFYFLVGGIFMFALCLLAGSPPAEEDGNNARRLELITLAFFSRMFVYSGSSIVWIATAELLTTKIRATGHSVANAVARVGAFLAPFLVSPSEKPSTIGLIMFLVSLFIVVCVRRLPETAGQPLGMHEATNTRPDQRIKVPTDEVIT